MAGAIVKAPASSTTARKVMVVAEPTRESSAALQYALSHVLVEEDTLMLLHLDGPIMSKNPLVTLFKRMPSATSSMAAASSLVTGSSIVMESGGGGGEVDFIDALKQVCEKALPKLKVQVEKVTLMDPRDKPNLILHYSTYHSVDLLVIGQRRSLSNAILKQRKNGSLRGAAIEMAEFLIENSKCNCVAVQRKGQNGGFILNTKTHRNFWLLA